MASSTYGRKSESLGNPYRAVHLSPEEVQKLISAGNPRACLYYICSLSGGQSSVPFVASALGWSREEAAAARTALEIAGLCVAENQRPPEDTTLPGYSPAEINQTLQSDEAFKSLVDYTKLRIGKLLTTPDVNSLLGLYSHLGLSAGVLMLLISYVAEQVRKKNGEGARIGMRAIEREGYFWYRSGITTEFAAEEYIRRKNRENDRIYLLARLLQIRDRSLTPSEEKYLMQWADYHMEDELIYHAYDKTVLKTGSLKWNYMNSILTDWNAKNIRRMSDLAERDRPESAFSHKPSPEKALPTAQRNAAERLKRMRSGKEEQGGASDEL